MFRGNGSEAIGIQWDSGRGVACCGRDPRDLLASGLRDRAGDRIDVGYGFLEGVEFSESVGNGDRENGECQGDLTPYFPTRSPQRCFAFNAVSITSRTAPCPPTASVT